MTASRPVVQIEPDDDRAMFWYPSISAAARDMGCDVGAIFSCLKGITSLCRSWKWRYKDSMTKEELIGVREAKSPLGARLIRKKSKSSSKSQIAELNGESKPKRKYTKRKPVETKVGTKKLSPCPICKQDEWIYATIKICCICFYQIITNQIPEGMNENN